MKDLDLNGDGVVDKDEFSRWFFTGMKAYNGNTRSMLQMRNQTVSILDVLAKDEILQLIKDDKTMTKHKVRVQFNEPPEDQYIQVIGHVLGPYTEKMRAEQDEYIKDLGNEVSFYAGDKIGRIYLTLQIAMKPGGKAKYEEYCKRLQKFYEWTDPPRGKTYDPEPHVKFFAEDDKIIIKFLLILPERISNLETFNVPLGLKEGLKDVDQYAKVKVNLGVSGDEILSSDKPLAEHGMKGFKAEVEVKFLKKVKKAIVTGMEGTPLGNKIKEVLNMAGPAFSVGSNIALDLTFQEFEEIKAHPMASTLLVSLD